MTLKKLIWPAVGTLAIVLSGWLLYRELRGLSLADLADSLAAIPASGWILSGLCTLAAYAALAGYDRIAVISAIGTQEYYARLGFAADGHYMTAALH